MAKRITIAELQEKLDLSNLANKNLNALLEEKENWIKAQEKAVKEATEYSDKVLANNKSLGESAREIVSQNTAFSERIIELKKEVEEEKAKVRSIGHIAILATAIQLIIHGLILILR